MMNKNKKNVSYSDTQLKAHGDALIEIEKHVAAVHVALSALAEDASRAKDALEDNKSLLNGILNDYENSEYCNKCEEQRDCVCANTNNGNCCNPECENCDGDDKTDLCIEDLEGNIAICEDLLLYIKSQLSNLVGLASRYTGICITDSEIWGDDDDKDECEHARNLKSNGDIIADMIKSGEVTPIKITGDDCGKIVGALKDASGNIIIVDSVISNDKIVIGIDDEKSNEGEIHCQAAEEAPKEMEDPIKKADAVKKEKHSILHKKTNETKQD